MSSSGSTSSNYSTTSNFTIDTLSDVDTLQWEVSPRPKRQACDQCHRRKTRCFKIDDDMCRSCRSSGLRCTFGKPALKRGPKGKRGRIIDELRKQGNASTEEPSPVPAVTSWPTAAASASPPISLSPLELDIPQALPIEQAVRTHSTLGLLFPAPRETMQLDLTPLFHPESGNDDTICLSLALAAHSLIVSKRSLVYQAGQTRSRQLQYARHLLQMTSAILEDEQENRQRGNQAAQATISVTTSIATSLVLFYCCVAMAKSEAASYHLNKAKAVACSAALDEEQHYAFLEPALAEEHRSLYWLLFVTERSYAILNQYAPTLQPTIHLPNCSNSRDPLITGLVRSIQVHMPFDGAFSLFRNNTTSTSSVQWLSNMERQLDDECQLSLDTSIEQGGSFDAACSFYWLKIILWQTALQHELLSSNASSTVFCFSYPVQIAQDLLAAAERYDLEPTSSHNITSTQKVFDIACALVDVMKCVPLADTEPHLRPWDYLHSLSSLLSSMHCGTELFSEPLSQRISDAGLSMDVASPFLRVPHEMSQD